MPPEKMWQTDRLKVFVAAHEGRVVYQTLVRFLTPFTKLWREGLIEKPVVGTFSMLKEDPATHGIVRRADLIYNRAPGDGRMVRYCQELQNQGKRVIVDLDDDFRRVDPLNPVYATMGTEEVWAERKETGEKHKLWCAGERNFDPSRNRRVVDLISYAVSHADLLTVTQFRLAERLADLNPNIEIIPNPVEFDLWFNSMPRPGFRIGWMGGDSHVRDAELLIAPVTEFLKRHDDAVFVVGGSKLPAFNRLPEGRWEHHEWVETEAFPYWLQWLGFHVGLAPIQKTEFNAAKSVLKWEEYAAMGVPTIASNWPPYSDVIRSGEDGILVDEDGWLEALERVYAYREETRAIAEKARHRVRVEYGSDVIGHQWLDAMLRLRDKPILRLTETNTVTPFLGDQSRYDA